MTVTRDELHAIDFSDVETGERITPIHPGEILRTEFMEPLGLSSNALAMALHVPAPRINDVVRGMRGISPDTALRLARYFGTTPEFWTHLQGGYDLRMAYAQDGSQIEHDISGWSDLLRRIQGSPVYFDNEPRLSRLRDMKLVTIAHPTSESGRAEVREMAVITEKGKKYLATHA